ncbi:MAG: hypothetical protein IT373_29860 [Polyangiaceae bacterium]|nr:hypothetical protein [Polyangiaceae bacterium]
MLRPTSPRRATAFAARARAAALGAALAAACASCVPEGGATERGNPTRSSAPAATAPDAGRGRVDPPLGAGFSDDFERAELGPEWRALSSVWRIQEGELCAEAARNRGVWLRRVLPASARIEFDARSESPEGDLKAEVWGDGKSGATEASYTDATSYLVILGGWKNTKHVLARLDEHGKDRVVVEIEDDAQDPRARRVAPGQRYHFRIERFDAGTLFVYVDDLLYFELGDREPLLGEGHDHFGLNDWTAAVCFDNVKVTPL